VLTSCRELLTIYSNGLYYSEILTDRIQQFVTDHDVSTGLVNIVLQHTTSALLLVEHEAGILMDLKRVLEQMAPDKETYHHHLRGVDENGAGHILSALFNKTVTVPIDSGELLLGTYQEIMFMDFQPERTERIVAMTIMGEVSE
jgi:secondary thiamine-phosphate synthase enzyme